MTGQTLRVNLAASNFPLLSSENGRSAIFTSQGETATSGTTGISAKYQQSTPQPIYLSNILPTTKGITSVKILPDEFPMPLDKDLPINTNLYIIKDAEDRRVYYLAHPRYNYVFDPTEETWVEHYIEASDGTETVTIAYLKGHTYIFIENVGCFEYSILSKTFTEVDLIGLESPALKGITVGGGLLVAYDADTIYWSSASNPLDFMPSQITGAGSTKILAIKATITLCASISDGFIIYTANNAVQAISTTDLIIPFIYKEIENFTGITDIAATSYGSSSENQYCWSPAGLVRIDGNAATIIHPEVTEFLSSKMMEVFNTTSNIFDVNLFDRPVNLKIRIVGNRFFTVSYGDPDGLYYTQALIYNIPLQRWGKLEANHIDIFDYAVVTPYSADRFNQYPIPANDPLMEGRTADSFSSVSLQYTDPAKEIGLVSNNGMLMTAVPDSIGTIDHFIDTLGEEETPANSPEQQSLVILGDYALTRTQFSQMQSVEIDTLGNDSSLQILSYLKQQESTPLNTIPVIDEFDDRKYWAEASGKFHRLLVRGEFFLSTVLICIDGEGEI